MLKWCCNNVVLTSFWDERCVDLIVKIYKTECIMLYIYIYMKVLVVVESMWYYRMETILASKVFPMHSISDQAFFKWFSVLWKQNVEVLFFFIFPRLFSQRQNGFYLRRITNTFDWFFKNNSEIFTKLIFLILVPNRDNLFRKTAFKGQSSHNNWC